MTNVARTGLVLLASLMPMLLPETLRASDTKRPVELNPLVYTTTSAEALAVKTPAEAGAPGEDIERMTLRKLDDLIVMVK